MNLKLFFAILIGKLLLFLTKSLGLGGGSAAPGLYALKIEPALVEKLIAQIPRNIIITGTNGKTTTSKFLAHFAKQSSLKVIRNSTGSNLERGIASTLIQGVKLTHTGCVLNRHIGIWELDEAAFNNIIKKTKPDIVVFLNVFRDQLDRYGEVDLIVKKWKASLANLSSGALVLINGDDANTAKLAKSFRGKSFAFGVKGRKIHGESIEKAGKNDFEARDIKFNNLESSNFQISINSAELKVKLPLPGLYHVYDFLAAFAAGYYLNLSVKSMLASLSNFSPAFGRVEKIKLGDSEALIFLIKNPTGASLVFEMIAPQIKKEDRILIALNDNFADGKDVSWIWDTNFEVLQSLSLVKPGDFKFYCSGTRAQDLALRLKYASVDENLIKVESNLNKALHEAKKDLAGRLYILPTYTALLEFQKILVRSGHKRHYWEESYAN